VTNEEQGATGDARTVTLEHKGGRVPVLVHEPLGGARRPAIVLGAEAYGINAFTRDVAARLAAAGYVVLVPDYYRGESLSRPDDYSDFTEVMGFIDRLDFGQGTHDMLAAIDHARSLSTVDGRRVLVWGYCTGGTLALLAACLDRQLAGAVLFFPSQPTFPELTPKRPVQPIDLLWNVACPVQLLYGDEDPILATLAPEIERRLTQWGVEHEIRVYAGAGHAFSAPDPPLRNDAADTASWPDALAFAARVTGA
jgi:carboxymethylenebutenolidase